MYKLDYFPEIHGDFDKLEKNVLQEVKAYLKLYKSEPYKYSQKLYNQGGINLKGYRKTYIDNSNIRIVIKIENNIAKIVEVVAIGERKDLEVYKEAFKRITQHS